jgi:hypothetical protein
MQRVRNPHDDDRAAWVTRDDRIRVGGQVFVEPAQRDAAIGADGLQDSGGRSLGEVG